MNWEFVKGITPSVLEKFKSTLMVSESDVDFNGFIELVENCEYPVRNRALLLYVEFHKDEYEAYWHEQLGERADVPLGYNAIETYLKLAGKERDFNEFIVEKSSLLNAHLERDEIQQRLIDDYMGPLFDKIRKAHIFLYRDSDHKGVFVDRD